MLFDRDVVVMTVDRERSADTLVHIGGSSAETVPVDRVSAPPAFFFVLRIHADRSVRAPAEHLVE